MVWELLLLIATLDEFISMAMSGRRARPGNSRGGAVHWGGLSQKTKQGMLFNFVVINISDFRGVFEPGQTIGSREKRIPPGGGPHHQPIYLKL